MDDKTSNPSSYAELLLKESAESPADQVSSEVDSIPEESRVPS